MEREAVSEKYPMMRKYEVVAETGLSYSTIYRLIKVGKFPRPKDMTESGKSIRWCRVEIDEWMENRRRSGGQFQASA